MLQCPCEPFNAATGDECSDVAAEGGVRRLLSRYLFEHGGDRRIVCDLPATAATPCFTEDAIGAR